MSKEEPEFRGDCFEATIAFMTEARVNGNIDDYILVHGVVRRYTDNLEHVHAWIELASSPFCLDVANGRHYVIPKAVYYSQGYIEPIRTVRYTAREMARLCIEHEHCGPWDDELNRVQDEAIRTLTEGETR